MVKMTSIFWDPNARDFMSKLPRVTAQRIYKKVDLQIRNEVTRYLETVIGKDYVKNHRSETSRMNDSIMESSGS